MSQPLDRLCEHEALGELNKQAGEFWVKNALDIPNQGENLSAYERNRVYLNVAGKDFIDGSFASGADIDSDSRSVIAGDFNADQKPDLLVGSVGGGALRLFINQLEQPQRLQLELVGTKSNRMGIGTRITIEMGDSTITRDVFSSNGCMGLGPIQLSIGVGETEKIDKLSLRWPSGIVDELRNLAIKKHTIREGEHSSSSSN